ncbi:MAG TPA: CD225/dispanin family protein [Pyrinomonadaceae bacterium]|nr:CD225/dispanin family protein [Pyrinomonadaceae bacterium]
MQQPSPGWTPPPPPAAPPANIPNYLVPAIISTICCCLPAGIVSIIFATQVNSKLKAGDIQGAMDASAKAKMWFIIAIAAGVIVNVLVTILQLAAR